MSQGGVPYTSQQNEQAKQKPKPEVKPGNNGEKLYRKCPTCGAFQEMSVNPKVVAPMEDYWTEEPIKPNVIVKKKTKRGRPRKKK